MDFLFSEPKAYAIPVIRINPNYPWFGIGSSVMLDCFVAKATNQYKFEWTKVRTGKSVSKKREFYLWLSSTSDAGTYKCEISRPQVLYATSKFINLKGNVSFLSIFQLARKYCIKFALKAKQRLLKLKSFGRKGTN